MNTSRSLFMVGLVAGGFGLLAGYAGSLLALSQLDQDMSVRQAIELQQSFATIASSEGKPKDYQRILREGRASLAFHLIGSAQSFASLQDPQWRSEVVRLARMVESEPELQDPGNAWAAEARRCIVEHADDPRRVAACVNAAGHAPVVVDGSSGARS